MSGLTSVDNQKNKLLSYFKVPLYNANRHWGDRHFSSHFPNSIIGLRHTSIHSIKEVLLEKLVKHSALSTFYSFAGSNHCLQPKCLEFIYGHGQDALRSVYLDVIENGLLRQVTDQF